MKNIKIGTSICALILFLSVILTSGCIQTGTGYSIDTIYGAEQDGLVWKTWSVWLTNDHPSYGKDISYSAIYSIPKDDTKLIEQINYYANQKDKQRVKIYYRNEAIVFPWDYSSSTIIYKVEPIN